jgi:hypothetical protein
VNIEWPLIDLRMTRHPRPPDAAVARPSRHHRRRSSRCAPDGSPASVPRRGAGGLTPAAIAPRSTSTGRPGNHHAAGFADPLRTRSRHLPDRAPGLRHLSTDTPNSPGRRTERAASAGVPIEARVASAVPFARWLAGDHLKPAPRPGRASAGATTRRPWPSLWPGTRALALSARRAATIRVRTAVGP